MCRRWTIVILGALLLVACAASSSVIGGDDAQYQRADPDGPMRPVPDHGSLVRGSLGSRVTDGFEVLHLLGSEPATILEVRSIGGDHGLRFLGAKLAGPERRLAAITMLPGFPPRKRSLGPLTDAVGSRILPRDDTRNGIGYELLLGYEIVRDTEIAYRSEIEVTYRVGGELFTHVSRAQLVYCPEETESETCFEAADAGG